MLAVKNERLTKSSFVDHPTSECSFGKSPYRLPQESWPLLSTNDRVLLDSLIANQQEKLDTPLPDDEAFTVFACEQLLKEFPVSTEEVIQGIVDGPDDGGIDAIYTFVNNQLLEEDAGLLKEDHDESTVSRGVVINLLLVQVKRRTAFSETTIDKVSSTSRRLLDLEISTDSLLLYHAPPLVDKVDLFRRAWDKLAIRHPQIDIEFAYITRGDTDSIHPKVQGKARDLESQLLRTSSNTSAHISFYGASELWASASEQPGYTLRLAFQESATSDDSYVALVTLREYVKFLTDDNGTLRQHIFDWNVRDHYRGASVNREIGLTLRNREAPDFWWLNNGVTVICSHVSIQGKTFTLDDVQIVNGLQTSYTIFNTLGEVDPSDSLLDRTLLVRILETSDLTTRDLVIRATNKQTPVPEASLRATDNIQRQIEVFLKSRGVYYDRRKNYYRNQGVARDRIVGIPLLAQTIMAIGLSRPDHARARPSSLLKSDEDYERIFSPSIPLNVYYWASQLQKQVDSFLYLNTTRAERNNLRFHLAMLVTARLVGHPVEHPEELEEVADQGVRAPETVVSACFQTLTDAMRRLVSEGDTTPDKVAKGPRLLAEMLTVEGYG